MKKFLVSLFVALCCMWCITDIGNAKTLKVSVKNYKDSSIQYASIQGKAYKQINKKMLDYAKKTYAYQTKQKKRLKSDIKNGLAVPGMRYSTTLKCTPKFISSTKVSVLCDRFIYEGGAHGLNHFVTFNTYKGKQVVLKDIFQSDADYKTANNIAKQYMIKHSYKPSSIKNREFYWTKTGINVVFDSYKVTAGSSGMVSIPISKKYLK